jgi:hypothetical protein
VQTATFGSDAGHEIALATQLLINPGYTQNARNRGSECNALFTTVWLSHTMSIDPFLGQR